MYRQAIESVGLSLEEGTGAVPHDGKYYVLLAGEIKSVHRTLRAAQKHYEELRGQLQIPRKSVQPTGIGAAKETIERFLDREEEFWQSSYKHRKRGGKGR